MQGERTRPASAIVLRVPAGGLAPCTDRTVIGRAEEVLILDDGYGDSNIGARLVDRGARHLVEAAADEELRG